MEKSYILTCDAGTTGCKATVIDADGVAQASARAAYPTLYPQPNWSEQDMDVIWRRMAQCVRDLLDRVDARSIAAVGLTGTMNGCIPVDAAGNALCPNIIHSDSRAWPQLAAIEAVISREEFHRLTGCRLDHHYMLPKTLWLREHRPEIYEKARWWLNTKDFLYGRLTGAFGVTDYSDASLTVALDLKKGDWARGMLADLGLDAARFPEIRPGHDLSGRVSAAAARETGLLEGTPVAVGGGDGACASRGAGVGRSGSAYCYIGSSAWVSQLTDAPILNDGARLFHYLDMDGVHYHSCGTVQCGASAYDWALANLLRDGADPAPDDVEAMARSVAPGAEGVLFLPTLMGERTPYWDPNTRGALIGFSLYHDRRHIARAVYEGVAFALATCAGVMEECGRPVRSLMISGGGARSGLWPELLAALIGVPTRVHETPGEATAIGAAIAAGVGAGFFASYEEGAQKVRSRRTCEPDGALRARYGDILPVYQAMYDRLKPLFTEISTTRRFS